MSTPTDVILRELKSIDIGAIDPHNMARTLSRVLDLTIPALSEIAAHPPTSELVEAAQAVVERWDSPLWKDVPHTGEFINRLRRAIDAHPKEVAPTVEKIMEVVKDWEENELGMLPDWDKLRARLKTLFP